MAEAHEVVVHQQPDVEQIPRSEQQHELRLTPILVNTTPWRRFFAFTVLVAFDIGMNAAAGACAATVGAHMNHKPFTSRVARLGALAGLTKAAMTAFREVVLMAGLNMGFQLLLILIFTSFGICLVVTAEICNLTFSDTPKELLIAAIVAAIPLFFESIRDIEPKASENGDMYNRPMLSVALLGTNALGGYVYARMAANQGMPISNYSAACSAGAVFGTLTFLSRMITGLIACIKVSTSDKVITIFGTYEYIEPDPIILSDEEYRRMNRAFSRSTSRFMNLPMRMMSGMQRVSLLFFRIFVCCAGCCLGDREEWKEMERGMREDMKHDSFIHELADVSLSLDDMLVSHTVVQTRP